MSSLKVMLVAGEASGDMHGAELVREIRRRVPELEAFGFGGGQMITAGVDVVQDLVSHAVIGVAEALRKLGDFYQILKRAEALLANRRPDVLVLIDFPDMNFRIAARAKALGIRVVYYISPQVWAWRRGRVQTLKKIVNRMLVVFPFEEAIYRDAEVPVTFVGHPLLDLARPEGDPGKARKRLLGTGEGPLISLLPGSRAQEIEMLLPVMCRAAELIRAQKPSAVFFIPLARTVSRERVETILRAEGSDAELVTREPYACRAAADLALVASGTATLETAILGVPQLIVYRMHWLSYALARVFVKMPYFGLANVVAGQKTAPEFLQGQVTPEALAHAALGLLAGPAADAQRRVWAQVRGRLGGPGAAGRAAEEVIRTAQG
ncbi:MAG: lipid-A-disaccharide synthase [Candidatus Firestonebacteria bacterium]|nr:lipid-A-disaccharide synthase [Candidatus Firestonebacteria bacterium]